MLKNQLKNQLIVSCQALENEPLHSSFIMGRMALAATQAGAGGIRANSVNDIEEIKRITNLPIIGIIKKDYPNSNVYITPTKKEIDCLAHCDVEIIALDATKQERPSESLEKLVQYTRENYPNILLMADISTIDEGIYAEKLGFDFIGTTLHGYTTYTKGQNIADNEFSFLKNLVTAVNVPVIAEGKINTPEKAQKALANGAHCVVVGGAITRPQEIAKKFHDALLVFGGKS